MDLIALIILIYAIKCAVEDSRRTWRKSKTAYMRSIDARYPSVPRSRRTARAVQHDLGYWSAQTLRAFPAARHGFAAGWQEGRKAKAEGEPLLWREVQPVNDTGGDCLYCGAEDSAECQPECPYLNMNWREVERMKRERAQAQEEGSPAAPAPEPRICVACGNPEYGPRKGGGNWGPVVIYAERRFLDDPTTPRLIHQAHFEDEATGFYGRPYEPAEEGPGREQDSQQERLAITQGEPVMAATAADTTYTDQVNILTGIRDDAEQEMNSVRRKRMMNHLDTLISLKLDSQSLSEAAAIDDALKRQEDAAREAYEAADTARAGLMKRHGGIQEAVDSSPVPVPAEPGFYSR